MVLQRVWARLAPSTRTDGASIVEYALLAALVGLALVGAIVALGEPLGDVFTRAAEGMEVE